MGIETNSNVRCYRRTTTAPNEEILDFSDFGTGKFVVQRLAFLPDTDCDVVFNNRSFTDRIEGGIEISPEDVNITSLKIVQAGTSYYLQYFI